MIQVIPLVDTTFNEPNKITYKQGKYLLYKFLIENKLLSEFVRCYKYARYKECKTIEEIKTVDKMTCINVLYDCISRVKLNMLPFCEVFNYGYITFNWWETPTYIDWFKIHCKWQKSIGKLYFRRI
jgi:hypothetical protein